MNRNPFAAFYWATYIITTIAALAVAYALFSVGLI